MIFEEIIIWENFDQVWYFESATAQDDDYFENLDFENDVSGLDKKSLSDFKKMMKSFSKSLKSGFKILESLILQNTNSELIECKKTKSKYFIKHGDDTINLVKAKNA